MITMTQFLQLTNFIWEEKCESCFVYPTQAKLNIGQPVDSINIIHTWHCQFILYILSCKHFITREHKMSTLQHMREIGSNQMTSSRGRSIQIFKAEKLRFPDIISSPTQTFTYNQSHMYCVLNHSQILSVKIKIYK